MVNNAKNRMINIVIVLAVAVTGAILTMGVDFGGTRWLEFVLSVGFFLSISSPAFFSSSSSCRSMFSRLRRRS
jgi:hypothetical protein